MATANYKTLKGFLAFTAFIIAASLSAAAVVALVIEPPSAASQIPVSNLEEKIMTGEIKFQRMTGEANGEGGLLLTAGGRYPGDKYDVRQPSAESQVPVSNLQEKLMTGEFQMVNGKVLQMQPGGYCLNCRGDE